jgi:hypothetical protein
MVVGAGALALLSAGLGRPTPVRDLVVLGVVVLEVTWSASGAYDVQPRSATAREPQTVELLRAAGVGLGRGRAVNLGIRERLVDEGEMMTSVEREKAEVVRLALVGGHAAGSRIEVAQIYLQGYPPLLRQVITSGQAWPGAFAPRLNVTAALVPAPRVNDYGDVGAEPAGTVGPVGVVRLHSPWPRAYLAGGLTDDGRTTLERLAVLPPGQVLIPGGVPEPPVIGGAVRIIRYEFENIELAVDAPRSAFLVLNDEDEPGWSATVDGTRVPLLRANGLVRAIRVNAGRHEVRFTYRIPGLPAGLVLFVLLVAGSALALSRREIQDWLRPAR